MALLLLIQPTGRIRAEMTALRVAIGLIWVLSLLTGRGIWYSTFPSPIAATSAEIIAQPPAAPTAVTGASTMEPDDPVDSRVDLFGNEIEDAIADYRIDVRGTVYERHSPETAMPMAGSPST